MICFYTKFHTPDAIGPFVIAIRVKAKYVKRKPHIVKFYVVFTVHFDIIQQLNQQMHFIS
jgi:hypothetical protein